MKTVCKMPGWGEACGRIWKARERRDEAWWTDDATFRALERARRRARVAERVLWGICAVLAGAVWIGLAEAFVRRAFGG